MKLLLGKSISLLTLAGGLALSATLSAQSVKDSAGPKYVFPVDARATDEHGRSLYVSDDAIRATIPGWKDAGKRLGTCTHSMTVYGWTPIVFPPRVTGAHTAIPRRLECEFDSPGGLRAMRGNLVCTAPKEMQTVYFDQDPNEYFSLESSTKLDEAFDVLRALRQGSIVITDADKLRHYRSEYRIDGVEKKGDQFTLTVLDRACYHEGSITVAPLTKDGKTGFTAVYNGPGIVE